ncbi:hypothetical protein BH10PSE6_BH10PSE6_23630 [soil metagenome]
MNMTMGATGVARWRKEIDGFLGWAPFTSGSVRKDISKTGSLHDMKLGRAGSRE